MLSVWPLNSSQKILGTVFRPLPNAVKSVIYAALLAERRFPALWNCYQKSKSLARSVTISIRHMKVSTWENTEIIGDISVSSLPRVRHLSIRNIVKIALLRQVGWQNATRIVKLFRHASQLGKLRWWGDSTILFGSRFTGPRVWYSLSFYSQYLDW